MLYFIVEITGFEDFFTKISVCNYFSGYIEEFYLGKEMKLQNRFKTFDRKYIRCCQTLSENKKIIGSEDGFISIMPIISEIYEKKHELEEKDIFLEEEKNEETSEKDVKIHFF